MTNPQNNSNLAPWKWAVIGAGSTLVLTLACFGLYNLLNPKTSSTSTPNSNSTSVANTTPENSVAKQLIGQWQGQISGKDSWKLFFTPEGKLFILTSPTLASELEYQTDVKYQPKHLDLFERGKPFGKTIFDFTTDGQLRLELYNIGEFRPTSFSSNAIVFQKISEQATLPPNVEVIYMLQNQENTARQSEAKQSTGSMNRAQQAFYAENTSFASSIEKLGIGIKSETENYSYSIVVSNDNRWVQGIGLAKREGLKNYTGIVFLTKNSDNLLYTQAKLCESTKPSKELPGIPTATNYPDIQCPSGYSEVLK